MDTNEQERLRRLLDSVEKEERQEEATALADREILRRQLFGRGDDEFGGNQEEIIERHGSDVSVDHESESNHDTDSETSIGDLGDQELLVEEHCIYGKDNVTKWSAHMIEANLRGRIRQHNIIRPERLGVRLPCPRNEAVTATTPIDAIKLFLTDDLVNNIVEFTNIWIEKNRSSYTRDRDCKPTDAPELRAVLGLLYLSGVLKSSHTNLTDLWATDGLGVEYFKATMSLNRFRFLLRAIRFDDITTRRQRRAQDKLAPMREVFEDFVSRCKRYYVLSEFVTIDEMLEAFRGRCPFRQYIPNKPARYGIKLFALCDSRTYYTANLEVYTGTQPDGPFKKSNSAADIVKRLIEPISGSGRHLTTDNWYGSVPLAEDLIQDHKMTLLSTIRKNKKEIPPAFINGRIREECSSLFAYQPNITLLSYVPRKNKVVLLISSLHYSDTIDPESGDKKKPEILTCYNKYKGGVDTVDQMKAAYSVSRKNNRWTLTLFFSMMNIAGINSYLIWRHNTQEETKNRRDFLKSVGTKLCQEQMMRRASMPMLPVELRHTLRRLLGQPVRPPLPEEENEPRTGRCYLCGRKKNRKTQNRCSQCRYFICREHTKSSCVECAGQEVEPTSSSEDDV